MRIRRRAGLGTGNLATMLLRNVPVGRVPATPSSPTSPTDKDDTSESAILRVARLLGEPVGYRPEHGGRLVQNLVPTRQGADRQISTSSAVALDFHTETAFHPYLPRYLLLLCLRGDPEAATTFCSARAVIDHLTPSTVSVLFQPRFRCGVDESFTDGAGARLRPAAPVLRGDPADPSMVFDADLMVGVDEVSARALTEMRSVVAEHHEAVVLERGDLLVIDNTRAVHGRSPYRARFDGSDRWLQRAFVIDDLGPSAADRDGRVVTTRFA